MIRRISNVINHKRINDIKRRFKERREKIQLHTEVQKKKLIDLKLNWKHFVYTGIGVVMGYGIYKFNDKYYHSKQKFLKRMNKIYNQTTESQDQLRIKANPAYNSYLNYFFPNDPLAVVYPCSEEEIEKIVELAKKYQVAIFTTFSEETLEPFNTQEHEHYILLNLKHMKNFSFDQKNNLLRAQTGLTCRELNTLLEQNGYKTLFDKELQDIYLFQVINYNLPMDTQSLSKKLINLDIVTSEAKVFRTAPDIEHFGCNPKYNDLFIGSKGLLGIPGKILLKIQMQHPLNERLIFELTNIDPNYKVANLKSILNQLQYFQNIETQIVNHGKDTFLEVLNYSKERLEQKIKGVLSVKQFKKVQKLTQQVSWGYTVMYKIKESYLYQILLSNEFRSLHFSYRNGILKVEGEETALKRLNDKIVMEEGLLIWMKDFMTYEKLKKANANIELGQSLIELNMNMREFWDPEHRFINTRNYENYIKPKPKLTFRNLVSSFW